MGCHCLLHLQIKGILNNYNFMLISDRIVTCLGHVMLSTSYPTPTLKFHNLSDFQPQRFLLGSHSTSVTKWLQHFIPVAQLEATAHFWGKEMSDMQRHVQLHVRCVRPICLPFLCLSYSQGWQSSPSTEGKAIKKGLAGVYFSK